MLRFSIHGEKYKQDLSVKSTQHDSTKLSWWVPINTRESCSKSLVCDIASGRLFSCILILTLPLDT